MLRSFKRSVSIALIGLMFCVFIPIIQGNGFSYADEFISIKYAKSVTISYGKIEYAFKVNMGSKTKGAKTVTISSSNSKVVWPSTDAAKYEKWVVFVPEKPGKAVLTIKVKKGSGTKTYKMNITVKQPKKYKVTFNPNGGKFKSGKKTKMVISGSKYGTLPVVTKTGWDFNGWWTKKSGGKKVTASTKMKTKKAHTLYAHWYKKKFKVTLDANGGYSSKGYFYITTGNKYTALPTPTKAGYSFNGWWTKKSGGKKITTKTMASGSDAKTLFARWTAKKNAIIVKDFANVDKSKAALIYNTINNGSINASKCGSTWYYIFSKDSKEVLVPVSLFAKKETRKVPTYINEMMTYCLNEKDDPSENWHFMIKDTSIGTNPNGELGAATQYNTTITNLEQIIAKGSANVQNFYLKTDYDSAVTFQYADKIHPTMSDGSFADYYKTPSTPAEYKRALSRGHTTSIDDPITMKYEVEIQNPGYCDGNCFLNYYTLEGKGLSDTSLDVADYIEITSTLIKVTIATTTEGFSYSTLKDLYGLTDYIKKESQIYEGGGENMLLTQNIEGENKKNYCYGYKFNAPVQLYSDGDYIQFEASLYYTLSLDEFVGTNTIVNVSIK